MPCIASSFRSAHKPCGSCNAIKSREWLNLIYKIAGGLSCRTDNVCSWQILLQKSFSGEVQKF
jgi:hypothetical protein